MRYCSLCIILLREVVLELATGLEHLLDARRRLLTRDLLQRIISHLQVFIPATPKLNDCRAHTHSIPAIWPSTVTARIQQVAVQTGPSRGISRSLPSCGLMSFLAQVIERVAGHIVLFFGALLPLAYCRIGTWGELFAALWRAFEA